MPNFSFLSLTLAAGCLLDWRFFISQSRRRQRRRRLSAVPMLSEWCPALLVLSRASSNPQREQREGEGRKSWEQGPNGGHHSHALHADDSQKGYPAYPQLHISMNFTSSSYIQRQRLQCDCVWNHLNLHHWKRTVNRKRILFSVSQKTCVSVDCCLCCIFQAVEFGRMTKLW